MGMVKVAGGAAPLPAPGELGKGKNYSKPARGTHHLTVVQGSLGLVGAIGAAAAAVAVAAVRRGPAALEDGGGGAGALPAPARCSAHAHASAARSRPRVRAAPSPPPPPPPPRARVRARAARRLGRAGAAPLTAASAAAVGDSLAPAGEPGERPAASPPLPRGEAEGLVPALLQQHVSPRGTAPPAACSAVLLRPAGGGCERDRARWGWTPMQRRVLPAGKPDPARVVGRPPGAERKVLRGRRRQQHRPRGAGAPRPPLPEPARAVRGPGQRLAGPRRAGPGSRRPGGSRPGAPRDRRAPPASPLPELIPVSKSRA